MISINRVDTICGLLGIEETPRYQAGLVNIFYMLANPNNKHLSGNGGYLSYEYTRELLGRKRINGKAINAFDYLNDKYGLVIYEGFGDRKAGLSRQCYLTPKVINAMKFGHCAGPIVRSDGTPFRANNNVLSERVYGTGTVAEIIAAPAKLLINPTAIIEHSTYSPEETEVDRYRRQACQPLAEFYTRYGFVSQELVQHPCGRYFDKSHGFQSMFKDIRNASFSGGGNHIVDITNCHAEIALQFAKKHNEKCLPKERLKFEELQKYCDNSNIYRDNYASLVGCSKKAVKTVILALLNGAKAKGNTYYDGDKEIVPAVQKSLGRFYGKALEIGFMQRFENEFGKITKAMIKGCTKKSRRKGIDLVTNATGISLPANTKTSKLTAHIMQSIESEALLAMVNPWDGLVGTQLPLHDGQIITVINPNPHLIGKLETAILERTGYDLKLTCEEL